MSKNSGLHVLFDRPQIPPNTGNAIRMCAGTGATLHLAGPLGFNFEEKHVRRAGLDYHDLADVRLHDSVWDAFDSLCGAAARPSASLFDATSSPGTSPSRVFAFTTKGQKWFTDVAYQPGDVLMFGPEPTGLDDDVLNDPRVTEWVRIPMLPGRRSMNLSNAAAVAAYEAWRQMGFPGGQ
ncbi:tRNA (cytidine(34)-2'-O)-methyltransferase [uncultured Corynebacterium sp.]|uniref:tRNA (cytidine(34)-2'-O)-methyltransferase n=1 Tax=uncultured Corynebacterium sp. TaxID=159447 RepID=UPI0025EA858D|nr:tRNA (cytidine(34)-2'-O)-methyltransferase [uncultured Corynebacterium sp.]